MLSDHNGKIKSIAKEIAENIQIHRDQKYAFEGSEIIEEIWEEI
jgi:hypothetical protein